MYTSTHRLHVNTPSTRQHTVYTSTHRLHVNTPSTRQHTVYTSTHRLHVNTPYTRQHIVISIFYHVAAYYCHQLVDDHGDEDCLGDVSCANVVLLIVVILKYQIRRVFYLSHCIYGALVSVLSFISPPTIRVRFAKHMYRF